MKDDCNYHGIVVNLSLKNPGSIKQLNVLVSGNTAESVAESLIRTRLSGT